MRASFGREALSLTSGPSGPYPDGREASPSVFRQNHVRKPLTDGSSHLGSHPLQTSRVSVSPLPDADAARLHVSGRQSLAQDRATGKSPRQSRRVPSRKSCKFMHEAANLSPVSGGPVRDSQDSVCALAGAPRGEAGPWPIARDVSHEGVTPASPALSPSASKVQRVGSVLQPSDDAVTGSLLPPSPCEPHAGASPLTGEMGQSLSQSNGDDSCSFE